MRPCRKRCLLPLPQNYKSNDARNDNIDKENTDYSLVPLQASWDLHARLTTSWALLHETQTVNHPVVGTGYGSIFTTDECDSVLTGHIQGDSRFIRHLTPPLFSWLGGPFLKHSEYVKEDTGRFVLRYNNALYMARRLLDRRRRTKLRFWFTL